ncbi:MAG TPA: hypothetical protein ENK02_01185 [Planctomycetes bacterium]|nr:hypothetical protein [Planctomycetota bacterium]
MMPIMKSRFFLSALFAAAVLLLGGLLPGGLQAQAPKRVKISVKLVPAKPVPGQKVTLVLQAKVQDGYHIYSTGPEEATPTQIKILDSGGLKPIGDPVDPMGVPHQDALGNFATWLKGDLVFKRSFEVPKEGKLGTLKGRFVYLPCTEDFCEQRTEEEFQIPLGGESKASEVKAPKPKVEEGEVSLLSVRVEPETAAPGQKVRLILEARVKEGWHVYGPLDEFGTPPEIKLAKTERYQLLGETKLPSGEKHTVMGTEAWWIMGEFEASTEVQLAKGLKPGTILTLEGKLAYTPCTKDYCLQPKDIPFKTEVKIAGAALDPKTSSPTSPPSKKTALAPPPTKKSELAAPPPKAGSRGGLWKIILGGILAGLLALLMPCTYPMIPITFSFFTKQAHDRHGSIIPLTLVYGAGIVGVFILIGLVVGQPIILFATHWLTNLVIGTVFVIFALSLFGIITLNPPRFLMDAAGKASMKGGYLGVFLMGTTLVITSFTCTVPFVSTLLAAAATHGSLHVIAGMGAFGLTMALPFMALSLIPSKMQALPRAGEWMNTLKVFLGFVEIAAAFKFFSNVDLVLGLQQLPNELFLALWTGIFLIAGFYLLGMIPYKTDTSQGIGSGRLVGGMATILLAFYFAFGALGYPYNNLVMNGLLPGYSVRAPRGGEEAKGHSIVVDDFDKALRLARSQDKRLLINFTGFA